MNKSINVIGLGYIGLPTALILAQSGWTVTGTDINSEVINSLQEGRIKHTEEGLEELFQAALRNGIQFDCNCVEADVYIIAVPTPFLKSSRKLDASYVISAVKSVLEICPDNACIAIESTISPGCVDKFVRPLIGNKERVNLAHVPERIVPGKIIMELRQNDRTIGVDNYEVGLKLKEVYASFCDGEITITDIKTAEMTKVVENTYRDINIAFANELSKICDEAGLDVYEVIKVANKHPRVNILAPGPGVGGHCISVDPWFLVGDYPGLSNIILAARKINDSMPEYVLQKVSELMQIHGVLAIGKVGFYGLTYKENVDDVRESPTLQLIECMKRHLAKGAVFYDPYIDRNIVDNQVHDLEEFIEKTDIIVIMVGHDQIVLEQGKLNGKVVLDTRNVLHEIETYHL